MIGVIVNTAAVFLGGFLGMLLKKGLPQKLADAIYAGLGLCVLYIGISGSLSGEKTLVMIISMVIGTVIGTLIDLDKRVNSLGKLMEKKLSKLNGKLSSVSEGFVSASLLFCVGAMAIVGSLQSGISGDNSTIFTKSLIDGIAAIILSSTLGIGVALSGILVFVYQGSITLMAHWISPFLNEAVINEMNCVGYIIIAALALNMLKITKLKVMNFVPAIFMPIIIVPLYNLIGI